MTSIASLLNPLKQPDRADAQGEEHNDDAQVDRVHGNHSFAARLPRNLRRLYGSARKRGVKSGWWSIKKVSRRSQPNGRLRFKGAYDGSFCSCIPRHKHLAQPNTRANGAAPRQAVSFLVPCCGGVLWLRDWRSA